MTPRHTRAAIVAACRRMMQAGRLRPTMRACCAHVWLEANGDLGDELWSIGTLGAIQRASRDAFRRIGNVAKAAHYERRLAVIETREPEPWAVEAGRAQ